MQRRLQESQVADVHVRHVTAEREMVKLTKQTPRQSKATEHDRGEHRADVGLKALGKKALHNVGEYPQSCGASAAHGSAGTDSKKNHVPLTHSCGDEKSSVIRARKQFVW